MLQLLHSIIVLHWLEPRWGQVSVAWSDQVTTVAQFSAWKYKLEFPACFSISLLLCKPLARVFTYESFHLGFQRGHRKGRIFENAFSRRCSCVPSTRPLSLLLPSLDAQLYNPPTYVIKSICCSDDIRPVIFQASFTNLKLWRYALPSVSHFSNDMNIKRCKRREKLLYCGWVDLGRRGVINKRGEELEGDNKNKFLSEDQAHQEKALSFLSRTRDKHSSVSMIH